MGGSIAASTTRSDRFLFPARQAAPRSVDRILVAMARDYGATLITRDRALLDYREQGHIRVGRLLTSKGDSSRLCWQPGSSVDRVTSKLME
jgi:hypothetical protein